MESFVSLSKAIFRGTRKLVTTGVAALTLLIGTPHVAWGEDPDPTALSSYFMTREELIALCQDEDGNWLSGENSLLAKAENTPVRIAFGRRPQGEHYYNENYENTEAPEGPISWLVAGGENCDDGNAGLVLWSEEPLIGCTALNKENRGRDGLSSSFLSSDGNGNIYGIGKSKNTAYGNIYVDSDDYWWNNYFYDNNSGERRPRDGEQAPNVYSNHWGASDLRYMLNELRENGRYFDTTEQGLMVQTTGLTTTDMKKFDDWEESYTYTTSDYLYAPRNIELENLANLDDYDGTQEYGQRISLGANDNLEINANFWRAVSWLRSPDPGDCGFALVAEPDFIYVSTGGVTNSRISALAGFKLNLTTVKFASAAAPALASGVVISASEGDNYAPLYIRVESADMANTKIKMNNTVVTVTDAPVGARLMGVVKGGDGKVYQISKDIEDRSLALDVAAELPGVTISSGKVWVETGNPEETTVFAATKAEDLFFSLGTTVEAAGQSINVIIQDWNKVLPEGTQLHVDVAEPGTERWEELKRQTDATYPIENIAFFEITLYDRDGKPLKMPLDANVRVLLQIPEGWDRADLEAVLVQAGADIEFDEDLANIDGVEYLSFWTNHFGPYAMIDKLTPAEKAALKTGEAIGFYAVLDAILLAAAGALVLLLTKKRREV